MKDKKQVKDKRIEIRVTAQEKEELQNYAAEHGTSISNIIRLLCEDFLRSKVY